MKYLISAGPTREKIDPVRFLSNRSSGKMGYALATAAQQAGHDVTLVSGPVNLTHPAGVKVIPVESAAEMAEAVKSEAENADVIIMSAAVADYRPVEVHGDKLKKSDGKLVIELERTEDILASLGQNKKSGQLLVGFAAETRDVIKYAQDKLKKKNLDWIVANDVSRSDRGFASDSNAATMISADGQKMDLPLQSKSKLAKQIISILSTKNKNSV